MRMITHQMIESDHLRMISRSCEGGKVGEPTNRQRGHVERRKRGGMCWMWGMICFRDSRIWFREYQVFVNKTQLIWTKSSISSLTAFISAYSNSRILLIFLFPLRCYTWSNSRNTVFVHRKVQNFVKTRFLQGLMRYLFYWLPVCSCLFSVPPDF